MPHVIKACDICQEPYICFMVKKELWQQIFKRYDCARVCLNCFEKRLGRKLTHKDLMTAVEIFEVASRCNDFYREALRPL